MDIPDTLRFKIEHFRRFGRLIAPDTDIFGPASWSAVHIGQLNFPERTDPILGFSRVDDGQWLEKLRTAMAAEARRLPTHRAFIRQHCAAGG